MDTVETDLGKALLAGSLLAAAAAIPLFFWLLT